MPSADLRIASADWLRLLFLSVLWGGSFLFVGVAVLELPPFTIVFVRVGLAALLLLPLLWIYRLQVPRTVAGWRPFVVMALLNNVIPFSLLVTGQTMISGGLASVINAMTPVFTVLILAAFGEERLVPRRVVGVLLGLAGVIILRGLDLEFGSKQSLGILSCLGATVFFGLSALWAKRQLTDVEPITAATLQLLSSGVMMFVIAMVIDRPWQLPMPGAATWISLLGLAALSTSLAFILFFQIIRGSGAGNVMLVTLLVPVTAIMLGYFILDEIVTTREMVGALVIASALLIMDGRLLERLSIQKANA
ncbi:MAG: ABC transporter permease [Rhizobiales bacterium 62-47]|nr:DMT family transporter [Hyphomicrobiales bacterium]OJY10029.1 MAG: ABC transporter permease [Rhizobiales bacterium 62-47]